MATWPDDANVGGTFGGVFGAVNDTLAVACIPVSVFERPPVRVHIWEELVVTNATRLSSEVHVALETVAYTYVSVVDGISVMTADCRP